MWEQDNPFYWATVLDNKIYCPSHYLERGTLWEKLNLTEDLKYEFPNSQNYFIRAMLGNLHVPETYMKLYLVDYSYIILDNPNVTQDIIDLLIQKQTDEMVVLEAACHSKASTDFAIPVMIKHFDMLNFPSWHEERIRAEKNIDSFLAKAGWDQETLDNVPLLLKLNVIK